MPRIGVPTRQYSYKANRCGWCDFLRANRDSPAARFRAGLIVVCLSGRYTTGRHTVIVVSALLGVGAAARRWCLTARGGVRRGGPALGGIAARVVG
jgi:hypothetical protein